MYEIKKYDRLKLPKGISEKALAIHQDKLYAGYVNKLNEITEELRTVDLESSNQTYSVLRELKIEETFATNGVILHENYFSVLSDTENVEPADVLLHFIIKSFGSYKNFEKIFSACGMAVRGWVLLAWDTNTGDLKIYGCDSHSHGGIWGVIPLLVLDVYEHAYFIDYGSDRKTYIENFMKTINWKKIEEKFEKLKI